MKLLFNFIFIAAFSTLVFKVSGQDTIQIPQDYATIQEALDRAVDGSIILVAPGTYHERINWPLDTKSIKLIGQEGSENTIIDASGQGRVVSMNRFINSFLDSTTCLRGFTLTNGFLIEESGSGLMVKGSPTLRDLKITYCVVQGSHRGGGAKFLGFSGELRDCHFIGNMVKDRPDGGWFSMYGTALYLEIAGSTTILDCTFSDNSYSDPGRGRIMGLGLYSEKYAPANDESSLSVIRCKFKLNSTGAESSRGLGIYAERLEKLVIDSCVFVDNKMPYTQPGGATVYTKVDELNVLNSTFIGNEGSSGAAIYVSHEESSKSTIDKCIFKKNSSASSAVHFQIRNGADIRINNSLIVENTNHAFLFDGFSSTGDVNIAINHCTISKNSALLNMDITSNNRVDLSIINSICWDNGSNEIQSQNGRVGNAYYSIFEGGSSNIGVIDSDPLFVDTEDYLLNEYSPAIRKAKPSELTTDLAGNLRPMPANTFPDMGAFEINQAITSLSKIPLTQFTFSPNPADNHIYFDQLLDQVLLTDVSGQVIKSRSSTTFLSLKALPAGVYFIRMKKGALMQTKRIIVN